jgi:hypothetical protein
MNGYSSSTTEVCDNLFTHCDSAYQTTFGDQARASTLVGLAKMVSALEVFVRGYERISDPSIDTDDEILNWAFSEVAADLCSAIWLLSSGFYKASASSLRNAFDIATASLYFQIRQNTEPAVGAYNRFFAEWEIGERQTPNWRKMKPFINNQPSVARFTTNTGVDILEQAYAHFKYLCSYTHTAAFAGNGDPVTAINTTGITPRFEEQFFLRSCGMTSKTISLIAIMWQVVFPQIVLTIPPTTREGSAYAPLFDSPFGRLALAHR